MIHPTAIIDSNTKIGSNVTIGPYSIIKGNIIIGSGTIIGPHVVIDSYTEIGNDCHIFQYASIGAEPQALKFEGEETWVKIGSRTIIREFATINRGTGFGGGITEVGEENFIMAYAHIAHDCKTGKNVILANVATLAGHVTVGDYATIGGLAAVHQFVKIGDYAYISGKAAVNKDIPPYTIGSGDRAKLYGLNHIGLKRHGFSEETLAILKKTYQLIFRKDFHLKEALEKAQAEIKQIPEVVNFINFIKSSERGITR